MHKTLKGKVTPLKTRGQTKISSFFSKASISEAYTTVQDGKREYYQKPLMQSSVKNMEHSTRNSKLSLSEGLMTSCNTVSLATDSSQSPTEDSDSDLDIIENTPDAKFNRRILDVHEDSQSPDCIPPTPENRYVDRCMSLGIPLPVNLSKRSNSLLLSRSRHMKRGPIIKPKTPCTKGTVVRRKEYLKAMCSEGSSTNSNDIARQITANAEDIGLELVDLRVKTHNKENTNSLNKLAGSLKRPANKKTGVSPDPKRNAFPDIEGKDISPDKCKLDLSAKFEGENSLFSDDESFSLINSHKMSATNKKKSGQVPSLVFDNPVSHSSMLIAKNAFDCSSELSSPDKEHSCRNEDAKELYEKCKSQAIAEEDSFEDLQIFHGTQGFNVEVPEINVNSYASELPDEKTSDAIHEAVADMCEHSADEVDGDSGNKMTACGKSVVEQESFIDDDLAQTLEQMSPFKIQEVKVIENKAIKKLLSETLGENSFAEKGAFGRHVVTEVNQNPYKGEIILHLSCFHTKASRTCSLKGFWSQSAVNEGDIVHILFAECDDGHFIIDDKKGLIVINPDYLISGTSVVSGVFCRRKSILNERFKGFEPGNQSMLVGSLVHELFQEVVSNKITGHEALDNLVRQLMTRPNALRELYGLGLSEAVVYEEMKSFIPHINEWTKIYLRNDVQNTVRTDQRKNQWKGKILEIQDIEETVWSPKFGVKGKIDLTVKILQGGVTKVVPLELKTGRSSFSAEHKGQVTIYSMMSADRRDDPGCGLLLYLRDGAMEEVPAGEKEKRGLIQLRNEMVHYLTAKAVTIEESKLLKPPSLPEAIDFERACNRCGHLLTCTVYQKSIEEFEPSSSHAMFKLIPQTTNHLAQSHLEYFRQWCLFLHLEMAVNKKDGLIRALWCKDAAERESSGDCISSLVIDPTEKVIEIGPGQFVHKFVRSFHHQYPGSIESVGLQAGENIVISSQREIAVTYGVLSEFHYEGVRVITDRNLQSYPHWQEKVFTIDRCEYQNTMSFNFTNLARLLIDDPRVAKLRALIVDRIQPSFKKGLPADIIAKGKSILRQLNKSQQRAVLRTLMANDYSLLKGFPGTGKTSTIVALVQLMLALGYSVLLTSYTHSAVDNILLKLKSCEVDFLRLGKTSRIHPDIKEYSDERLTSVFRDVKSLADFYDDKLVVATTCLGTNHVLFSRRIFDFCIVDEASQVLQPAVLGPLFQAHRFVLVGDPQQLPPLIQSSEARDLGMGESLFARLDSLGATSCLTQQYRMNGHIMKLANLLMYDGQLQCANSALETATITLPNYTNEECTTTFPGWIKRAASSNLENSVVFLDTCGCAPEDQNSNVSAKEASLILVLIISFLKAGLNIDDIGVITPYRDQVKYLRNLITKNVTNGSRVEVNTVDQYQGRDKSVILYSCVRSATSKPKNGDILQDEHRLNVAITRAKYKLILIGDISTLQNYKPFKTLISLFMESSQVYTLRDGIDGFHWSDFNPYCN